MEHPLYREWHNEASYPHECTISIGEMETKQYEENNSHRWASNSKTSNMKASELRIGNYIYGIEDSHKKTAMEICSLHSDDTFRLKFGDKSIGCYHCSRINPIPLTEEWLLKFNFEYVGNDMYVLGSFLITRDETDNVFYFDIDNPFSTPIRYIHQLQNIYFALNNKELKLL